MIENGERLVRRLDEKEKELKPEAAFWLYFPEADEWRLVLVEAKLGELGPLHFYNKIQNVLSENSDDFKHLRLDRVSLSKPDSPVAASLKKVFKSKNKNAGLRLRGNVVNGTYIEDAYVYPLN
jgi:hypothetical protein